MLRDYHRQQKAEEEEKEEQEPSWQEITGVTDTEKSYYQWLKDSTETLIVAGQEQALNTRSIDARFYHTRQDSSSLL